MNKLYSYIHQMNYSSLTNMLNILVSMFHYCIFLNSIVILLFINIILIMLNFLLCLYLFKHIYCYFMFDWNNHIICWNVMKSICLSKKNSKV